MSWNETEFGRDDGLLCDVEIAPGKECGAKTWVTDDDNRGYVTYECDRGHAWAAQYDVDDPEHDLDCDCEECCFNEGLQGYP